MHTSLQTAIWCWRLMQQTTLACMFTWPALLKAVTLSQLSSRHLKTQTSYHYACITACRLPMLDASVKAREDAAAFDTSRLVEFSERLLWEGPVLALSPLVREPGRLAITDHRVYFQPLHNISGMLTDTTYAAFVVSQLPAALDRLVTAAAETAYRQPRLSQAPDPGTCA